MEPSANVGTTVKMESLVRTDFPVSKVRREVAERRDKWDDPGSTGWTGNEEGPVHLV